MSIVTFYMAHANLWITCKRPQINLKKSKANIRNLVRKSLRL